MSEDQESSGSDAFGALLVFFILCFFGGCTFHCGWDFKNDVQKVEVKNEQRTR